VSYGDEDRVLPDGGFYGFGINKPVAIRFYVGNLPSFPFKAPAGVQYGVVFYLGGYYVPSPLPVGSGYALYSKVVCLYAP